MTGWAGFWIMLGLTFSTEIVVEYLRWKTKIEYNLKEKPKKWNIFKREK